MEMMGNIQRNYFALQALELQADYSEFLRTMSEIKAERENYKRRAAVIDETLEIRKSIDTQQVEDYCGPIRNFSQGECHVAKIKYFREISELLEVVFGKLDQLSDRKMKECDQLQERTKEINVVAGENLSAEEDVWAGLKSLTREMETYTVEEKKAKDELDAQIEVVKRKMEEVTAINNDQLQQHTKEIGKDDEEGLSVEESNGGEVPKDVQASESNVEDMDVITVANMNLRRELEIMKVKLKVRDELLSHFHILISKFEQEKTKVFVSAGINEKLSGESGGIQEVVRRIEKWESEWLIKKDTVIGLKKIGDDKELWNMKEDKVATLKEAIRYLVMILQVGSDSDITLGACT